MVNDYDLRIVFDVAVNSLDFGSGFLDDSEVDALVRLAEHLKVNSALAVPPAHQNRKYGCTCAARESKWARHTYPCRFSDQAKMEWKEKAHA